MAACHYDMIYDGDGVVCIQIAAVVIAVGVVNIAPKKLMILHKYLRSILRETKHITIIKNTVEYLVVLDFSL